MTPPPKHILITASFQKRLKKLRRHFSEEDVVANITDFIHFFHLKTGIYGKNLSFQASSRVVSILNTALVDVLTDYLEHTAATPKLTKYVVREPED